MSQSKQCTKFCKFCHDAGKPKEMVESHYVKDKIGGKPCCPTLAETECPYCHAKGHTWGHCERRKSKAARAVQRKTRAPRDDRRALQNTQDLRKVVGGAWKLGDAVEAEIRRKESAQDNEGFTLVASGPSCRVSGGGGGGGGMRTTNGFSALKQQQAKQQQQQAAVPKSVAARPLLGAWNKSAGLHVKIAENVEQAETVEAVAMVEAHLNKLAATLVVDLDPARDFGDDADSDDEGADGGAAAARWGDRC